MSAFHSSAVFSSSSSLFRFRTHYTFRLTFYFFPRDLKTVSRINTSAPEKKTGRARAPNDSIFLCVQINTRKSGFCSWKAAKKWLESSFLSEIYINKHQAYHMLMTLSTSTCHFRPNQSTCYTSIQNIIYPESRRAAEKTITKRS